MINICLWKENCDLSWRWVNIIASKANGIGLIEQIKNLFLYIYVYLGIYEYVCVWLCQILYRETSIYI